MENYYQNILYCVFLLAGFYVKAEQRTSSGRIDMTLETSDTLYVMELKLDRTAREALEQIDGKEYALPYQFSKKKVVKIGINFSSQKRNIQDWVIG